MDVLKQLSSELFSHLHTLDDEANIPSGRCSHAGLVDYGCFKGYNDKKYEDSWNDRLAELLQSDESSTSREFRYPNSRKKCDILLNKDDTKIWLEVKSAWKHWFSSVTGKQEKNSSNYKGYFYGKGKSHSIAQDIDKLNELRKENADYVGLLVIGFDMADDPIDPDMAHLIETMKLRENDWSIFGPEIWPDRNHPVCRYNCWFLGKKVSMEQKLIYSAYCKNCRKDISSNSDQDKALMPALEHCKKHNHELVFGMTVNWIEDSKDQDTPEHVVFCKVCHKDIAKGKNKDAVLRSAMEHCEKTKHQLAYGIVVKNR